MDNIIQDEDECSENKLVTNTSLKRKSNGVSTQCKKKSKNPLYKAPTADELHHLKETENLFNSNLFRLQIEELLQEVSIKQKLKTKFEGWYRQFASFLNNLPEHDDIPLSKVSVTKNKKQWFISDLAELHALGLRCDQELVLKFVKPETCDLTNLSKSGCVIGPNLNVSVAVQMPRICFHEKDYLNNRYLVKRYYYLMYLAKELSGTEMCSKLSYSFINDNYLLPVLNITPSVSEKILVMVYVVPFENYFKPSRFLPEKNNVRAAVFESMENFNENLLRSHSTPFYNTLMLHDVMLLTNSSFCHSLLGDFKNAKDAIKLLQVWTQQRDLIILNNLLLHLVLYLIYKRRINKHMSSYQIIRNVWFFIRDTDMIKEDISICEDVKKNTFEEFKRTFDVVFLDKSGCYNIAGFVTLELYNKLKNEAELAIKFLDSNNFDAFRLLFMVKVPVPLQYDLILRIESSDNFKDLYERAATDPDKILFTGCYDLLITKTILRILKQGLNKRVIHIVPLLNKSEESSVPRKPTLNTLTFGANLDIDHAFNYLERGPHPHDVEVKEFMEFWGEWSHLRRFPDGTMCEAVYFETKTIRDRRNIIKKIVDYVVTEKLQLKYILYFNQCEGIIAPPHMGTNEEASLKVITVSDNLGKILRSLSLPLEITTNLGISDVFSYTDPFPLMSVKYKWKKKFTDVRGSNLIFNGSTLGALSGYMAPIECVLHLSIHSKWPNDLQAIRNIKTAFYLKIADLLDKQQILSSVTPDYLDIYYEGLLFRYRIYHPKEVSFLKKDATTDGIVVYRETKESMDLEAALNVLPKIQGALKGIQSQYPSFGVSTALIKRWLRSQLLDSYYITDEVINLLNASLYLNSTPFLPPCMPQAAFLRFLKFISETDWTLQSIIVNFNEEITKEKLDQLETDFNQNRQNYPHLYIITPYDDGKSIFTRKSPKKEVLSRIAELAGECCKIICSTILDGRVLNCFPLFTPNLDGYNVIIHLRDSLNARRKESIKLIEKTVEHVEEYDPSKTAEIPIVNFNPVNFYLKELRYYYDDFALFFHDTYGGDVIGVLWKPTVIEEKNFKLSHIGGRRLTSTGKLILNVDVLLEDFRLLGKGLVKNIEQKL